MAAKKQISRGDSAGRGSACAAWPRCCSTPGKPDRTSGPDSPLQLREGPAQKPAAPLPRDAMDLFRLLAEQRVPYLLAGGLAMLTYVNGRNTRDVDLLMSVEASRDNSRNWKFATARIFSRARNSAVCRWICCSTGNPVFKIVAEQFATRHRFAELEVPTATVEGLIDLETLRAAVALPAV
jgi:hypothetical protein